MGSPLKSAFSFRRRNLVDGGEALINLSFLTRRWSLVRTVASRQLLHCITRLPSSSRRRTQVIYRYYYCVEYISFSVIWCFVMGNGRGIFLAPHPPVHKVCVIQQAWQVVSESWVASRSSVAQQVVSGLWVIRCSAGGEWVVGHQLLSRW